MYVSRAPPTYVTQNAFLMSAPILWVLLWLVPWGTGECRVGKEDARAETVVWEQEDLLGHDRFKTQSAPV